MKSSDLLALNGAVSKLLDNFESRPQQLEMAAACERALENRRLLLVEAGTGVGKSFAYLIPAVLWAIATGERVIVSTNTINLQEQLIEKDIPFLQQLEGLDFKAFLAKGRGNYICLRRLYSSILGRSGHLPGLEPEDQPYLNKLEKWVQGEGTGIKTDVDFYLPPHIWPIIRSEGEACAGRRCRYFRECLYFRDRHQWEKTDILVVNHALFFYDLALRRASVPFLPGYGAVIFDEAHNLEDVAAAHLGIKLSKTSAISVIRRVYDGKKVRGFFAYDNFYDVQRAALEFETSIGMFFKELAAFTKGNTVRFRNPDRFSNECTVIGNKMLESLKAGISTFAEDSDEKQDAQGLYERVREIVLGIDTFNTFKWDDCVYWADGPASNPKINVTPIRIDKHFRKYLWSDGVPAILTSATLATRGNTCDYIRDRLGIDESDELILGSPFNFRNNVKIFVPRNIPEPVAGEAYRLAMVSNIRRLVLKSEGRTFVLFTSIRDMKYCHDELSEEFGKKGMLVLVQDGRTPRTKMLNVFREHGRAVLFGVSSFWQGIDVRGSALSSVIICRLPFEVPTHPVVEARCEDVEAGGGSSFWNYSLPNAVLRLKQGFGRLIRTSEDRGFVSILDPRILTKNYGRHFINALPRCPIIRDFDSL